MRSCGLRPQEPHQHLQPLLRNIRHGLCEGLHLRLLRDCCEVGEEPVEGEAATVARAGRQFVSGAPLASVAMPPVKIMMPSMSAQRPTPTLRMPNVMGKNTRPTRLVASIATPMAL
jgi:hypothetical protein